MIDFHNLPAEYRAGVEPVGECLIWRGAKHAAGYPLLRRRRVHRLVWADLNGPLPGWWIKVYRSCGQRLCVRPDHLWAGTPAQGAAWDREHREVARYG